VVLERALLIEQGVRYPKSIASQRACPPEDVDGLTGHSYFLDPLSDPMNEEPEPILMWVDNTFDH
jgi:hypothetical protein